MQPHAGGRDDGCAQAGLSPAKRKLPVLRCRIDIPGGEANQDLLWVLEVCSGTAFRTLAMSRSAISCRRESSRVAGCTGMLFTTAISKLYF
jgi:hypothetical protein